MNRLSSSDKVLCAIYAVLGLVALVWTQIVLVQYLRSGDGSLSDHLFGNGAATFVTIDLLAVALAGIVFMVAEGLRLGMRFIWVYVLLAFAVAISVSLPLFLIVRQVHLAKERAPALTNR